MGRLWRAGKSRMVQQIYNAPNERSTTVSYAIKFAIGR